MGFQIYSVILHLIMEDLKTTTLNKIKFYVLFLYRYVNDCIMAIPIDKDNSILQLLQ